VLLVVVTFVLVQSFLAGQITCEVCMSHRGRSQCRTVAGADQEEASKAAILNACAYISGGVTDSMACQRAEPTSSKCW
jgi:hypothetical protein